MRVRAGFWKNASTLFCVALLIGPMPALAETFEEELARVDKALKENPGQLPTPSLRSCQTRRNMAVRLYDAGQPTRAERHLAFCRDVLKIPAADRVRADAPPTAAELQERAAREIEKALALTPNVVNGLAVYRECAACHMPEGWGLQNGSVPQIAGQHRRVVIKQLADIRAGNRDNVLMAPYASVESIGGAQAVADVAGYIGTLEISVGTSKGPGKDLALGEQLYREHCVQCHGETAEGDDELFVPRIQSQHYPYLVRQFEAIRDGRRRNANPEMVAQIQSFGARETHAVLDYVSRLLPPEELQAPPGWRNPDFADR